MLFGRCHFGSLQHQRALLIFLYAISPTFLTRTTHWMTVVIYFGPINIRRFGNQFKYQSPSHLFSGPSSSTVEQPPQMRTPTSVGAHNQASVGPRGSPCASRWRPLLRRLCCPSSLGGLGYHARLRVAPSSMRVPESERLVGRRLERKS